MKFAIGCVFLIGCVSDIYYPPTNDSGMGSEKDSNSTMQADSGSTMMPDAMVSNSDAMVSQDGANADSGSKEPYCAVLWGNDWLHFYCSQNPWVWYDQQAGQHSCSEACPVNSKCIMNGSQGYCNRP